MTRRPVQVAATTRNHLRRVAAREIRSSVEMEPGAQLGDLLATAVHFDT